MPAQTLLHPIHEDPLLETPVSPLADRHDSFSEPAETPAVIRQNRYSLQCFLQYTLLADYGCLVNHDKAAIKHAKYIELARQLRRKHLLEAHQRSELAGQVSALVTRPAKQLKLPDNLAEHRLLESVDYRSSVSNEGFTFLWSIIERFGIAGLQDKLRTDVDTLIPAACQPSSASHTALVQVTSRYQRMLSQMVDERSVATRAALKAGTRREREAAGKQKSPVRLAGQVVGALKLMWSARDGGKGSRSQLSKAQAG